MQAQRLGAAGPNESLSLGPTQALEITPNKTQKYLFRTRSRSLLPNYTVRLDYDSLAEAHNS